MKINNYVWENDFSLNDLVLKQKEKIDELQNQLQQKENIIKELKSDLEHTSKDDFNLEEHQKVNRYEAIQVVLQEIERLNNNWQQSIEDLSRIANELELEEGSTIYDILDKLQELKGGDKE